MIKLKSIFILLFICYGSITSAASLTADDLGHIISLRCIFDEGVGGEWKAKGYEIEKRSFDKMNVYYDSINIEKGTARFIGNKSAVDVKVIYTPEGWHFIEITGSGNLILTTVFHSKKNQFKKFPAVMSRHINIEDPFPSQFYGTCDAFD